HAFDWLRELNDVLLGKVHFSQTALAVQAKESVNVGLQNDELSIAPGIVATVNKKSSAYPPVAPSVENVPVEKSHFIHNPLLSAAGGEVAVTPMRSQDGFLYLCH